MEEVRELLYKSYGRTCNYCDVRLLVNNMVCDHVMPLSLGGSSVPDNLQMICMRCNTRKGPLTNKNFKKLLKWLKKQDIELKNYVLKKMASKDF